MSIYRTVKESWFTIYWRFNRMSDKCDCWKNHNEHIYCFQLGKPLWPKLFTMKYFVIKDCEPLYGKKT